MKGNKEIIKHLNLVLRNELTAINQYFLHAKMFKDWGITKLAAYEQHESIDEMKHADTIIDRILFLEGLPNLQDLDKLRIGQTIEEMLQGDLDLEYKACKDLKDAIIECEKDRDFVTRDMLRQILDSEEEHIDWLETQLGLIQKMGLENYVQFQSTPNEQ